MNWKNFGYICCLSCTFNFFLFQVLFLHLKFGQTSVELPPERIPTASHACITCGILNLGIVLLSCCYIKGIIKFNPLHYMMRIFNMAGRHGPATGANRYRRFTDSVNDPFSMPNSATDYERTTAANSNLSNLNLSESLISDKHNVDFISRAASPPPPPPPPMQAKSAMLVHRGNGSIQGSGPNTQDKKPPFEMIDLN